MKLFIITALILLYCPVSYAQQCNIKVPNMNFGQYNIFSLQPNLTSSNITIKCNRLATFTISATTGISNNYNNRQMKETISQDILYYNLYKNNNYTTIFGNGTNNTSTIVTNTTTVPIYAVIPPQQNVRPGSYNDTLQIQISF